MSHQNVRGAVILARNGDRAEYHQDPKTYSPGPTESTPLGESQAHQLGVFLRNVYLNTDSPSYVRGMSLDLVNTRQVHVRVKNGGEGKAVFDSCIALLQGLFPPNPDNKMVLANETTVVAPLGGYQYIPVETVEPSNDRSLESWTNCPAFEKHIAKFYSSKEFKEGTKEAEPFITGVKDFVFGTPASLENAYNVFDYISTELMHNRSYAHRLPPTYIEQAQHWANFHENGVFGDADLGGIGNIAGRTILRSILMALQRIVYDNDPLQFMVQEVTYQPFISLFHMTGVAEAYPELQGIPNYASALAIELRSGDEGDPRDFLRFKFKNGTADEEFQVVNVFGHHADIPLTEFIYRTENAVISSNRNWERACGARSTAAEESSSWLPNTSSSSAASGFGAAMIAMIMLLGMFALSKFVIRRNRRKSYIRLQEPEQTEGILPVCEKAKIGAPHRSLEQEEM